MPSQVVTHSHKEEVVFKKSAVDRYAILGVVGTLSTLAFLVSLIGPLLEPKSGVNSPMILLADLILIPVSLLFGAAYAGPCDMYLDPQTRRYSLTAGLPLFARTVQGSFSDIRAFVIRPFVYRGGTAGYQLDVEWTVPNCKPVTLRYLKQMAGYQIRDEIQTKLGLPVEWEV